MTRKFFVVLLGMFLLLAAGRTQAASVKVVVHQSNPIDTISRAKIADLFLKRVTRWESGRPVIPVDQSEKNVPRVAFTKDLLEKEVSWVKSYWQKMIFSGRATPPAELSTDAEVLELIRLHPEAIGYVDATTAISGPIKVVAVEH